MRIIRFLLILGLFSVAGISAGAPLSALEAAGPEGRLIQILDLVRDGRVDEAVEKAKKLIAEHPKLRLARVIYGDLLLAQVQPIEAFGNLAEISRDLRGQFNSEALKKYQHFQNHPGDGRLPASVLKTFPDRKWVIVVDVSESRLYLFKNGGEFLKLISDHYITIGKKGYLKTKEGDQKTPLGVYFITRRIGSRFLDDFYGLGALPINYPNEWDARLNRTGYGIWLHGVPSSVYNRFPNASDGCIALSNDDLGALWNRDVDADTPVIITRSIYWVDEDTVRRRRNEFMTSFERWRKDWESLDVSRFLGNYSREFQSEKGETYSAWKKRKTRVNQSKRFIKVDLSNIEFFAYPLTADLIVVNFDQAYQSDSYASKARKRQYWRQESDGVWRIVYEGQARFRDVHFRGIPYSARS